MHKWLAYCAAGTLFSLVSSSPAAAANPVNHFDYNEPKISGINVNKVTGLFPGIAIFNHEGYVIDLNFGESAPPGASHNDVITGYILPRNP